jgi:molybdate transport system regulatory protein
MTDGEAPELRLRILMGEDAMIGPGRADLWARIAETDFIAAGGAQWA